MQALTPALFALPAVAGAAALLVGLAILMRGAGAAGRRGLIAVLAVGGAGVFLGGTAFATPAPHAAVALPAARPTATPSPVVPLQPLALAALEMLPVEAAAPITGYDRVAGFGAPAAGAVPGDRAVTLTDAWRTGAQQLTAERRVAFADDPLNRLAVRDRDSGCAAAAQRIAVKRSYDLWVTPAERAGLEQVLAGCDARRLPF